MFELVFDSGEKRVKNSSAPTFENDVIALWTDGEPALEETVETSYLKKGFKETVASLDGCFSIVLLDKEKKELWMGRDRLGAKQLYYGQKGTDYCISSDFVKAYEFTDGKLSHESFQQYLSFQYVPEPATIAADVKALVLGSVGMLSEKGITVDTYNNWIPNPVKNKNREDFRQEIRDKFEIAVKRNVAGKKNPGAFLSGGLDSSILTSILAKDYPNLVAYTISFDVPGFSESEIAAKTAEHLGIAHKVCKVDSETFAKEAPFALSALGVPVADPSAVAVSLIAKAVEEGNHDVVLSGEGSDELWGGYHVYNPSGKDLKLMKFPKAVKSLLLVLSGLLTEGTKGKDFIRRGCVPLEQRFVGNTFLFDEEEKKKICGKNYIPGIRFTDVTKPWYEKTTGLNDMDKMQTIDTNLWLPGDIDVVCGKGCEKRNLNCVTPFMDNAITDMARGLTKDEKIYGGRNKVILREAFDGILIDEVKNGKKKGYPVPVRIWLSGELNGWAKKQIEQAEIDEFIDKKYAYRLLDLCAKNPDNPVYYRKAWAITAFAIWHMNIAKK